MCSEERDRRQETDDSSVRSENADQEAISHEKADSAQSRRLIGAMLSSANAFAAHQRRHVDAGSRSARHGGRRRQGHGRGAGEGLSGSALRRGEAQLHPQAAHAPTCSSSSAASSRSAGCRRSSRRAATRRSSPGVRAISTRRMTARILDIPTGQITRAMGDVHPLGQPALLARPRQRPAHRAGDSGQADRS